MAYGIVGTDSKGVERFWDDRLTRADAERRGEEVVTEKQVLVDYELVLLDTRDLLIEWRQVHNYYHPAQIPTDFTEEPHFDGF